MTSAAADGLVAEGLWLTRGDRAVLEDASLTVDRGRITALTAPSGAGKSTMLRCLNRLLDPDRGAITLGGLDVRSIAPRELRHRVGLVAQRPVMLDGSVADNLRYGLDPPPDESVLLATLRAAGLAASFVERDARALSGGEQARVAIARATIRKPDILLLDEPTAALDSDTAVRLGETFRELAASGIGVCVATHDHAFAERFADRVVHLDGTQEPTG